MSRRSHFRLLLALIALGTALPGCQAWRSRNDGQHLIEGKKHREPSKKTRTLQAEVTTGADGAVSNVRIVRSSGAPGVDEFVVESIRSSWPATPSQRTVVEVSHSSAAGFSDPKVLSTASAQ